MRLALACALVWPSMRALSMAVTAAVGFLAWIDGLTASFVSSKGTVGR